MLSKIFRKYFSSPDASRKAEPVRLQKASGSGKRIDGATRPAHSGIEMLEGRIAPATLVNPSTVIFTDADGDLVTVKFSKGVFFQTGTDLTTTLNNVFKFSTGAVVHSGQEDTSGPQQLQLIDLTKIPTTGTATTQKSLADGLSITITANKGSSAGDDLVNIGSIIGTSNTVSLSLGNVTIDGDLGQIDVGKNSAAVGLASLKVNSLGKLTNTQGTGTDFPNYESKIIGSLGSLTVLEDLNGSVNAVNGTSFGTKAVGKIGNVTIGGSLQGAAGTEAASNNTGLIKSATSIGKVKIGSGAEGDGIIGGGGENSGAITAGTKITSITIDGDLRGGAGANSGYINATGEIGAIKIGNGTAGHGILGGSGKHSGAIISESKIASISLNGDLIGGTGEESGFIKTTGSIGKISISGKVGVLAESENLSAGLNAGRIYSQLTIGNVTIGGDLEGGSRVGNGTIESDSNMGVVTIKGNIIGKGAESGGINAGGNLAGVSIQGDLGLVGGTGTFSGFIWAGIDIGYVKIAGDLKGNLDAEVAEAGYITSGHSIKEISIEGSIIGGKGRGSGSIQAATIAGSLEKVTIGGQLLGGEGDLSGTIQSGTDTPESTSRIGSIVIKGTGSEVAVQGGTGDWSGGILSASTIKSVNITGDVLGGEGLNSASIQSRGLITSVTISGDLAGGTGAGSGSIYSQDISTEKEEVAGDLGKLTIGGTLKAGEGERSGAIYAAGNLTSLTLGGLSAEMAQGLTAGAGSGVVATGIGFFNPGDVGKIAINGGMNGGGDNHSLLEIRGSLGSLSAREGIVDGDIHIAGNLGSLTIGTAGKKGVAGDLENVTLTAGSIAPETAKLATAIAKITVYGDVMNSQILAGYNMDGQGTNADAQIGSVTVSGNWTASDLVAGIKAVNDYFGDGDDEVIEGGSTTIASRIAKVIIGGTVSGTPDVDTDYFGFVAEEVGSLKVGKKVVTKDDLPNDVGLGLVVVT